MNEHNQVFNRNAGFKIHLQLIMTFPAPSTVPKTQQVPINVS